MKRQEVIEVLSAHRQELRDMGVASLALFGSVARNEATDASDVDLLAEFDRPIGLLHLIGAEQRIRDLLGAAHVHLVLRDSVIEELKEDILAEAINVFEGEAVEVPRASHARGD